LIRVDGFSHPNAIFWLREAFFLGPWPALCATSHDVMAHNLCRGLANGSQQSYPDSLHSFAQRLQEIRRQLEQLTSKGEEKLKIDDVGRWAAASVLQCFVICLTLV
jgi:hypothetical protein